MASTAVLMLAFLLQPQAGAGADPGARAFQRCAACHSLGPGASGQAGPDLAGVYGRQAAGDPAFAYSDALRAQAAKGLRWDDRALERYLADPEGFIPGTAMPYQGGTAAERAAVIDFLRRRGRGR